MDLKLLRDYLSANEGRKNQVYEDSAKEKNPTIGVGYNLNKSGAKKRITDLGLPYDSLIKLDQSIYIKDEVIDILLDEDIDVAIKDAKKFYTGFEELSPVRKIVLVDLIFNMGLAKLNGFKKFYAALVKNDWVKAGEELKDSKWFSQVGARAKRNIDALVNNDAKYFDLPRTGSTKKTEAITSSTKEIINSTKTTKQSGAKKYIVSFILLQDKSISISLGFNSKIRKSSEEVLQSILISSTSASGLLEAMPSKDFSVSDIASSLGVQIDEETYKIIVTELQSMQTTQQYTEEAIITWLTRLFNLVDPLKIKSFSAKEQLNSSTAAKFLHQLIGEAKLDAKHIDKYNSKRDHNLDKALSVPTAKTLRINPDVKMSSTMADIIQSISERYYAKTNKAITITSCIRTAKSQAKALYDKLKAGDDIVKLYVDKESIQAIKAVYDAKHKNEKAENVIAEMAQVIEAQIENKKYISKHLGGLAVDIRSRDLDESEKYIFKEVVAENKDLTLLNEGKPPHFHIQLKQ